MSAEAVSDWRDLEPHPYALTYRRHTPQELRGLANDLVEHGQQQPIWLYQGKILDGVGRHNGCVTENLEPWFEEFKGEDEDALSFVNSMNEFRRHLTQSDIKKTKAQQLEAAKELLQEHPEMSDRSIARQTDLSHHSVRKVREELDEQANGNDSHNEDPQGAEGVSAADAEAASPGEEMPPVRTEVTGKKARGRKPLTKAEKAARAEARKQQREAAPQPIARAHDQDVNTLADAFKHDPVDTWETCVMLMSGYDGVLQQKLSLVTRQEQIRRIARSLAVHVDIGGVEATI